MSDDDFRTRSPHDPAGLVSLDTLLARWHAASLRALMAEHAGQAIDPEDLFTRLALGTRIAQDITAGRWVTVAKLLRAGAIESWADVGNALGTTETAARDEFARWIAQQSALFERTGLGLTAAEAAHLTTLAEEISL